MDAKLRIGLLLDSVHLPAWAFTALERTIHSNCAELVLVVLNQSRPVDHSVGQYRVPWLYQIFNAIDERLFLRSPNALAEMDAAGILWNVPGLHVQPVDENQKQRLAAMDVEKIRSYHLDILVKMGFGKLQGEVLSVATYGIWTYRWGDSRRIEDGLTGFWEVARGWSETGAALQQLGPNAEPARTLFESWFSTYSYSPARNRNCILWSAASFLPRQIEHLHRVGGEKFMRELKKNEEGDPGTPKPNDIPSNDMVLWIMMKLAFRNLLEVYRRGFLRERWELRFTFDPEHQKDISTFNKISPPRDRFWADPHVIYKEPNYYVFVEEYLYRTKRGHIAVIEMDRTGNYKQPVPVLQEDCHLSFPFVFDWMGHYYMIPESSEKKTIDLYECVKFPDQWCRKITLMKDIKAVDTILHFAEGKWWLFTALAQQEAAAPQVELFLFYSDDLFTDCWSPHPKNPIVSDVKKARGAGSIFSRDGSLFRPSQDCSKSYGYGFDLNEIVTLSETEYCERTVQSVRPDATKKALGIHTYAHQEALTMVDILTRQPKWANTA